MQSRDLCRLHQSDRYVAIRPKLCQTGELNDERLSQGAGAMHCADEVMNGPVGLKVRHESHVCRPIFPAEGCPNDVRFKQRDYNVASLDRESLHAASIDDEELKGKRRPLRVSFAGGQFWQATNVWRSSASAAVGPVPTAAQ